jgi:hypothetical protein
MLRTALIRTAATILIAAFAGTPGEASDVDLLLDLLVRKNVVTGQEAAALRAEIARVGSNSSSAVVQQAAQPYPENDQENVATAAAPLQLAGDLTPKLTYLLIAWRFLQAWEGLARFDRYEPMPRQRIDTYLGGLNWTLSRWTKWQANYGIIHDNERTDNTQTVLTQLQFQF